jgi:hypothetical protein
MLSPKQIKQLQKILNKAYNQNLSLDEATQIANNWVGYFGLLAKLDQKITNKK